MSLPNQHLSLRTNELKQFSPFKVIIVLKMIKMFQRAQPNRGKKMTSMFELGHLDFGHKNRDLSAR